MKRIIFHIDVNNAFLSWTAVDMLKNGKKIDIRERYAVIGGDEETRRGIVLAKSNLCKERGVTTGESLYLARKKCPYLEVYPANHKIYKVYSDMMYEYLLQYTDEIERYSIDECFLDYTHSQLLFGEPIEVANKIKEDIKNKLGFTVNIGIGNNKLEAKMASDFSKPDKLHTLFDEEIKDKLWPLPVEELFMLGKASSAKLRELNINTIGELAKCDVNFLMKLFKRHGKLMWEYANGIDSSPVNYKERESKSISASSVLSYNYSNRCECFKVLKSLSLEVGKKLRDSGLYARNVSIWIKYSNFTKVSKQSVLDNRIHTDDDIYKHSCLLFDKLWDKTSYIRGLCVGVSDFNTGHDKQLSLFEMDKIREKKDDKEDKLQKVLDDIRDKYGSDTIVYADMINKNT